jgi:GT2 family glycosyltransferase
MHPIDVPEGGASIDSLVLESTLQALAEARRGNVTCFAATKLQDVQRSIKHPALASALRQLDSAWRCGSPQDLPALAPIYGCLLALEAKDHEATLSMLQRARESAPDANLSALAALTLLRLKRPQDARRALEAALSQYCIEVSGLLSRVAGIIVRHPTVAASGWVGRGPRLELIGELSPHEPSNVLDISVDGRADFTQIIRDAARDGMGASFFLLPQFSGASKLEVSNRGVPLLGSGQYTASDFGLDGQSTSCARDLRGWARVGWRPTHPPPVRIRDERGDQMTLKSARTTVGAHRWPFELDLRAAGIRGHRIQVELQLPNGAWRSLPDSPLILAPGVQLLRDRPVRLPKWTSRLAAKAVRSRGIKRPRFTDVIVPIYRGREESLVCLDAVLSTIDQNTVRVVVIDDATDDPLLAQALDTLALAGRVTLLRNAENQGFVRSVNRCLGVNPTHDAVILNSDTVVFADWLTRLRKAAYSAARVGTVTPWSNSGSIASYPNRSGGAIDPAAGEALHQLARSLHSGKNIEIPVGVGFCLYVRRDCLRAIGSLDADVFGKGYGEETDFCLRARSCGWSHRLAADVFVYHAGGLSFGAHRTRLLQRSQRLLNLRHPGYDTFIASFLADDPIQPLRRKLDEQRLLSFKGRLVLLVTSALTGGVDRYVTDRSRRLREEGRVPVLLRPAVPGDTRLCELWTDAMDLPNLRYNIPAGLESLRSVLSALYFESIEIQHFLHLDPAVIEGVRALQVPYDIFVHDYVWICPRITLIDETGRYCGEPAVATCDKCIKRNGTILGEAISVTALRARSGRWLRNARRVIAPSSDTAKRMQKHFSDLAVDVQPHSPPIECASPPRRIKRETVRVGLIGAIGGHKGYQFLLDCARDARSRRLPIEFVVIGYTEDDAPLLATGKVFVTGRYSEGEVSHLMEREAPDIFWSPSVWPETWCYTLDHALHAGLPIVTFDLGAIAERLRPVIAAVRLPLATAPARINDLFLAVHRGEVDPAELPIYRTETKMSYAIDDAKLTQRKSGKPNVNKTSDGNSEQTTREGLSASVQVLPLPPGLYLFSVRAATPIIAAATGQLSLPAVHVGLGPGARTEEVEFVAGPSTHGGWLFAKGDLLVAKIKGSGATLVLTSVRAPGGEVLSIKVERLEARADAVTGQANGESHERAPHERAVASKLQAGRAAKSSETPATDDSSLPLAIGAHIRTRGDMSFSEVSWAGKIAPGLWIESFSVHPLERFGVEDIEYKGLTGNGFETPWLSDDKMCGTKGMSTPLLGFAIRLKPSPAAAAYDCEYSGYFASGLTVGPLRNGVPCRSSVASDPLEGIQVRLVKRSATMLPGVVVRSAATKPARKKSKRNIPADRNADHSARSVRRTAARRS